MAIHLGFGRGKRSIALWVLASLAALLGIAAVMQRAGRAQLQADAEHSAIQWAAFARDSVPDLDQAFAGRGLTLEALRQLRRLKQAGEVSGFRLYDQQGRRILASEDIDKPASLESSQPQTLARHDGRTDARLPRIVMGGEAFVELRDEDAQAGRPALYSDAYVPVIRDGQVLGVVEVTVDQTARRGRIIAALRTIALAVAVLLLGLVGIGAWQWLQRLKAQRRAEEKVRYLAHHDALTGALNRASFHDALQTALWRAQDGGPGFAVLCIDLDGFKEVNESLGHAAGDELLRLAVHRLRETVRELDVVARLGGDEFAVLQSAVHSPEEVSGLGQRLVAALSLPYTLERQQVQAGGSVGAAVYGPDGQDITELLHRADQALFRAKSQQRGSFSFYDAALDNQLQARRSTARDLRKALHAGDLHLHFQPLYEGDGRTLQGYEALARWHHPRRGPIPPSEFIPLAEECGLIEDLGLWVLARACDVASTWPSSLSVAVNLSPAQFQRGDDLVRMVGECLKASALPASRLELEITESLLMNNTDQVVSTLHRLTGMGVRIAMDDFGTGYSSLAYLWRFPFDKVKIDRAFTQHLGTDPKVDLIVRSIVSLAHSLNIRVNAEGVETKQQLRCLQAHGCDELQGFLLGRPVPSTQLLHDGAPEVPQTRLPRAVTDFASLSTRSSSLM